MRPPLARALDVGRVEIVLAQEAPHDRRQDPPRTGRLRTGFRFPLRLGIGIGLSPVLGLRHGARLGLRLGGDLLRVGLLFRLGEVGIGLSRRLRLVAVVVSN